MKKILIIFIILFAIFLLLPPSRQKLYPEGFSSYVIYDRNGKTLREIFSLDYKTSKWTDIEEISPWMVKTTTIREDKRFFKHPGIDPIALIRAIFENIKHRKIVSGGSTITMQVAKMSLNFQSRNIFTKIIEMFYALKLELYLKKEEILEIYLNRVPYGNLNYGVESASWFYFRKPASQLSLGESSILAVIPKNPPLMNPYIHPERVLKEKEKLLKILINKKIIDSLSYQNAIRESLNVIERDINFYAPHFVDYILNRLENKKLQGISKIITSIDSELQEKLEQMLLTTLNSLKEYHIGQGSIVVIDRESGEILAMVGSKDYFDETEGQVNGALSLRQPGSSIKPFLYIIALESGIPVSYILPDIPLEFKLSDGTKFAPRNYGERYHGLVPLREALASSFNVPTVYLLDKIGEERFYGFLKELNLAEIDKPVHIYGLSLALGAKEVKLLDLVNAYRAIANKGIWSEVQSIIGIYDMYGKRINISDSENKRVFSRDVSYLITNILSRNIGRMKAFGEDSPLNLPFPSASKTGTSKDYRDNWCIGFTKKYVVGVWVGNFDGSSMRGVSGISGAGPLFRDIMIELHRKEEPDNFDVPENLVKEKICYETGKIAGAFCPNIVEELFISGTEPEDSCEIHSHSVSSEMEAASSYSDRIERSRFLYEKNLLKEKSKKINIINPEEGDIFKIDPQISPSSQEIIFKVIGDDGTEEFILKLDGRVLFKSNTNPLQYIWSPSEGEHTLKVFAKGKDFEKEQTVKFYVIF